ncbi:MULTISPECIES: glycosyltransferase family 2 protein [unclassified Jeotgalibaca]|uniref:glycosyltransferase family 2 protein n=1 Tax=unclassified Jeotgalibaca TaxID=2621505 RepID=UPI003FD66794
MKKSTVIIPTYNPAREFISYVKELIHEGIENIIIIDDGSTNETQAVFREIEKFPQCIVLIHPENRGKGAGLKTSFRYLKENRPDITKIVAADSDGQHAVKDVLNLLKVLEESNHGIVLGVRDFDLEQVPNKNAFGNKLTSHVFKGLFGTYISDTQTGLRGFHSSDIDWLLSIKGERFEYEMNMLMMAIHNKIPLQEVAIQTLYFGKKPASHYKTFRDSWRIAKQIMIGFFMKKRLIEYR